MQGSERAVIDSTSRRRNRLAIGIACLVACIAAGIGVKLWLDHRVPPPNGDPARVARYMASPAFATLSDAQKAPYLQAYSNFNTSGQVTPEQQRGIIANVMHDHGKGPAEEYFSLPPGKPREAFLDRIIDQQSKIKGSPLPPPGGKGIRIEGNAMAVSMSPEEQAQMDQFMQDLHDRRVARGLPDNGTVLFTR